MNHFNNILTKTEILRTFKQGGRGSRKFRKGGGICWTLASYILLRILEAKIANFTEKKEGAISSDHPLNQPMHYLH